MLKLLLLTLLTLGPGLAPLDAQGLDDVRVGARLRVTLAGATGPVIGSLVQPPSADTLLLRDSAGSVLAIPRAEIRRADVSLGRHGRTGKGALFGLLVGVGAAVPVAASCDCDQAAAGLVYGVLFGAMGAGLGALVGAAEKSEVWERLPPTPAGATEHRGVVP